MGCGASTDQISPEDDERSPVDRLTPMQLEEFLEAFKQYDTDGGGSIDADELRALMAAKADRTSVEGVVQQMLLKANVHDAVGLLDTKANVDDVNKSLTEVNRELAQRPTLGELNRVVGEQSLIMESLCSEHLLGRWIWKSGRTKGEKHLVPWNVQNINTNPDNFGWEKDRAVIGCAAPGLYEVSFG